MDKIEKFLRKLSPKDRHAIEQTLENIANLHLDTYDIKKLTGFKNMFRLRKGNIRIVFERTDNRAIIIRIDYRNENTYKGF